jgi:predicted ATPase
MLGYPDHALAKIHSALTLARESSHAFSLAFALNYASLLHAWRRELPLAQEQAEALIALSSEHGFIQLLGVGRMRRGWALAEQGAVEEGLAQLHQGLSTWRDNGTELGLPQHLALLAMAYKKGGRVAEELQVLDEAMTFVDRNDERFYEAELHRLKGELLLLSTPADPLGAERSFRLALEIAKRHKAKSIGLRAALSLARLRAKGGRQSEAHDLLAPIDVPHFVKTSGQDGLHVLIPLGGTLTHAEAKSFAEVLARLVVAERPDIATVVRPLGGRLLHLPAHRLR